jgi:hypothetical protein
MKFTDCENSGFYLRVALVGPPGSGKSYSALAIATELGFDKIGVIDTENKSARRYAKSFGKRFQSLELATFGPRDYIDALRAAEAAGIEVLIIDSLSHAWMGKGGILEQVDAAAKRAQGNSFAGWRTATPEHNRLVEALIQCRMHLIVTMRVKVEWVVDKDDRGKSTPRKVGLKPEQREGLEYEFDVVGDLNGEHELMISKSRCPALSDAVILKPGKEMAQALRAWVDGAGPVEQPEPAAHERGRDWLAEITAATDAGALELLLAELEQAAAEGKAPHGTSPQGKVIATALSMKEAQLGIGGGAV